MNWTDWTDLTDRTLGKEHKMSQARLSEIHRIDAGLPPQALNNTNVTGVHFPMKHANELLAVLTVGAMAATKTAKLELYQATNAAGTGSELIAAKAATATANVLANKATLTLATMIAGDTVTINGLVFTGHATVTDVTLRQFSVATSDTATAVQLAICINDATYGVAGVTAVAAVAVVTLTSTEPGETMLTITTSGATVTIATVEAVISVALLAEEMKINTAFTHVAAKVTTTANTVVAVTFIRNGCRFAPVQSHGATAG